MGTHLVQQPKLSLCSPLSCLLSLPVALLPPPPTSTRVFQWVHSPLPSEMPSRLLRVFAPLPLRASLRTSTRMALWIPSARLSWLPPLLTLFPTWLLLLTLVLLQLLP